MHAAGVEGGGGLSNFFFIFFFLSFLVFSVSSILNLYIPLILFFFSLVKA